LGRVWADQSWGSSVQHVPLTYLSPPIRKGERTRTSRSDSVREEGEGNALTQPGEFWCELYESRRRTAGGRCWKNGTRGCLKNRKTGQSDRTDGRLDVERDPFEHLPRRAHPGAEGSCVGRSLVMRMMRSVGDRLGINQRAEEQEADSQADCYGSPKRNVHDQHTADSSQSGCSLSSHAWCGVLLLITVRIAVY